MQESEQTNIFSEIEALHKAIEAGAHDEARVVLSRLHPSEIADLLESLPNKELAIIWPLIDMEMEGDVLAEVQDNVRSRLLEQMQPHEVAEVTKDLEDDDAADIIQDLPEDVQDSVLRSMDELNRQRLSSLLSYPEDTAGGLMSTNVIPIRTDATLATVTRYLRFLGHRDDLPEQTDNLMVVDRENLYLGVLGLMDIVTKEPELTVGEVMIEEAGIPAKESAQEVAKIFERRDWVSAAVVNDDGMLLGRITIDDVVDVIQEQADSTVRSMAGLGDDDIFAPVLTSTKYRAVWLGINLITAFLAAWVIGRFEDSIQQLVALAVLMPIVASMGGIAGSQTLTIAIRGIAMGHLGHRNVRHLIYKELAVGIINGVIWASVVSAVAILWFKDVPLGIIIGLAMIINLIVAAFAGAVIPLTLKRLGVDPAIAGGVILTTVTDVVGFMTFLGLATIFLLG